MANFVYKSIGIGIVFFLNISIVLAPPKKELLSNSVRGEKFMQSILVDSGLDDACSEASTKSIGKQNFDNGKCPGGPDDSLDLDACASDGYCSDSDEPMRAPAGIYEILPPKNPFDVLKIRGSGSGEITVRTLLSSNITKKRVGLKKKGKYKRYIFGDLSTWNNETINKYKILDDTKASLLVSSDYDSLKCFIPKACYVAPTIGMTTNFYLAMSNAVDGKMFCLKGQVTQCQVLDKSGLIRFEVKEHLKNLKIKVLATSPKQAVSLFLKANYRLSLNKNSGFFLKSPYGVLTHIILSNTEIDEHFSRRFLKENYLVSSVVSIDRCRLVCYLKSGTELFITSCATNRSDALGLFDMRIAGVLPSGSYFEGSQDISIGNCNLDDLSGYRNYDPGAVDLVLNGFGYDCWSAVSVDCSYDVYGNFDGWKFCNYK